MIPDLLVVGIGLVVFGLCCYVWRRRRTVWETLNTRLTVDVLDDAAIGAITVADLVHHINRNAPALLDYLHHLDVHQQVARVSDVLSPDGISSALRSGDLSTGHLTSVSAMDIYSGHALSALNGLAADGHHLAFAVPTDAAHALHGLDLSELVNVSDLLSHVPVYAIVIKGARNWKKMEAGDLSGTEWAVHTAVDVGGVMGGVGVGYTLGTKAAAAFAIPTGGMSIILIPLGAFAGALLAPGVVRKVKTWWYGDDFRRAQRELEEAWETCRGLAAELRDAFLRHYPKLLRALRRYHRANLSVTRRRLRQEGGFFKRLFDPTPLGMALGESIRRTQREFRSVTLPYYRGLVAALQAADSETGGTLIYNQGKAKLMGVEALTDIYDEITDALKRIPRLKKAFKREKKRLERKL
jgi:hypothetical protein